MLGFAGGAPREDPWEVERSNLVSDDAHRHQFDSAALRTRLDRTFGSGGELMAERSKRAKVNVGLGHFTHTHKLCRIVPTDRSFFAQHLGVIHVGQNLQPVEVLFDTGSANLWIPSALCKTDVCYKSSKYHYDEHKSGDEARRNGYMMHIRFGRGELWSGGTKLR